MKYLLISILGLVSPAIAALQAIDLRVEHEVNPQGVGAEPRFSWNLEGEGRGKRQAGFEILAASSAGKLKQDEGDLWSLRKEKGIQRALVRWEGEELQEGQKVFWKVRVKEFKGEYGKWSAPSNFSVGKKRKLRAVQTRASFESSNAILNTIFEKNKSELERRLKKYLGGDETGLGTGHEVQRSARDLMYLFDAIPALSDWSERMFEQQNALGYFPGGPGQEFATVHSDSGIAVPHALWWMSGDVQSIVENYPKMERQMIRREQVDPAIAGHSWGKPLRIRDGLTPEYLDLCYFGLTSRLMLELSAPAQKPNHSIRYRDYSARIRTSFKKHYLDADGKLKVAGDTAAVLAIRNSVMDKETRAPIIEAFVKNLNSSEGIGSLAAKPLLPVLTYTGNYEKALDLVASPDSPWLKTGEFLGSGVVEWLLSVVAGIDSSGPGFRQFFLNPRIPSGDQVSWAKASYHAPSGKVSSHWQKEGKGLSYRCTIPPDTLAILILPLTSSQEITESGKSLAEAYGVQEMKRQDGFIRLLVQHGAYHFLVE